MKMIAFWDVAPCGLVKVRSSATSIFFYETTRHHILEGCRLHTCRREALKVSKVKVHGPVLNGANFAVIKSLLRCCAM
jgi:hypothetical protein